MSIGGLKRDAARDGWYRELVIRFDDGKEEEFLIEMSRSGTYIFTEFKEPAEWTRLDFHKCQCCPLSDAQEYCPAAESLEMTLMRFRNRYSYESVEAIAVDGANRRTVINGTLQEVGSVFVQLAVFSSGCPIGKRLRPLLRDMRPFTTNNELTHYLISKLLLRNRGDVNSARRDIKKQLEPLHEVFNKLWSRLDNAPSDGDAPTNSIVRMDAFAVNVSLQLDKVLDDIITDMGWDSEPEISEFNDTATRQATLYRDEILDEGDDDQSDKPESHDTFWDRLRKLFGLS